MNKLIHKIKNNKKLYVAVLCALIAVIIACLAGIVSLLNIEFDNRQNTVIFTADFNTDVDGFRKGAYVFNHSVFEYDEDGGLNGTGCVKIENTEDNDARYEINLDVKKNSYYKISGWIKTENVGVLDDVAGANISVLGNFGEYEQIFGTQEWHRIEYYGKTSENQKQITLALRVGFYSGCNTGTAWFDDIEVTRVSSIPNGVTAVNFKNTLAQDESEEQTEKDILDQFAYKDITVGLVIMMIFVLIAFIIAYRFARAYDGFGREKPLAPPTTGPISLGKAILFLFVVAVLIRIVFAFSPIQCSVDVNIFKYWGNMSFSKGFANTYITLDGSIDYPPLYVYCLYFAAGIKSTFRFLGEYQEIFYSFLIKLAPMVADCVLGVFVYRICDKKMRPEWTVLLVAAWLLNPLVILESACWGQVDSVLAMFVLFAVYNAVNKKYWQSGLMLGLGIMLKPQAIIVVPIIFFILFKKLVFDKDGLFKRFIPLGKTLGGLIIGAVTPCLPFVFKMGLKEIEFFGKAIKVPWILSLFVGTANHYDYASVNAPNFWYLIGKNWVRDSEVLEMTAAAPLAIVAIGMVVLTIALLPIPFTGAVIFIIALLMSIAFVCFSGSISIFTWGMIAIIIICLFIWVLYMSEKKNQPHMPYLLAAAVYMGVSMFGPRMHERYFFTALIFLLVAVILSNNKIMTWLYVAVSTVGFLTVAEVLLDLEVGKSLQANGHPTETYGQFLWVYQTPYRNFLALGMVLVTIALFIIALFYVRRHKKLESADYVVWKLDDEISEMVFEDISEAPLLSVEYSGDDFEEFREANVFDEISELSTDTKENIIKLNQQEEKTENNDEKEDSDCEQSE